MRRIFPLIRLRMWYSSTGITCRGSLRRRSALTFRTDLLAYCKQKGVPFYKMELPSIIAVSYTHLCAANGWRPGKAMTEDEFLAAVAKFNNSPMNGRKSKEARK